MRIGTERRDGRFDEADVLDLLLFLEGGALVGRAAEHSGSKEAVGRIPTGLAPGAKPSFQKARFDRGDLTRAPYRFVRNIQRIRDSMNPAQVGSLHRLHALFFGLSHWNGFRSTK